MSSPSTAATVSSLGATSSAPACAGCAATTSVRSDAQLKAGSFSGGNQQKLVLAREIEHDPDLLLVGQPTRGVDIGAIEFIHKRLIAMRDAGKAVLLVSVELDEIMSLVRSHPGDVRRHDHRRARAPRRPTSAGSAC